MTVREALERGYTMGDVKLQRGYTSRKIPTDEREVFEASGRRKGQLYFLAPCSYSTRYCYRQYLR